MVLLLGITGIIILISSMVTFFYAVRRIFELDDDKDS